jgi:hypothetical protein
MCEERGYAALNSSTKVAGFRRSRAALPVRNVDDRKCGGVLRPGLVAGSRARCCERGVLSSVVGRVQVSAFHRCALPWRVEVRGVKTMRATGGSVKVTISGRRSASIQLGRKSLRTFGLWTAPRNPLEKRILETRRIFIRRNNVDGPILDRTRDSWDTRRDLVSAEPCEFSHG